VFGVILLRHGLEEHLKTARAANIFGRAPPGSIDQCRIVDIGLTVTAVLDKDVVPPVFTEGIAVKEPFLTAVQQLWTSVCLGREPLALDCRKFWDLAKTG